MTALSSNFSSKEFQRFSRFLTVGAVGTLLDFSLLTLLKLAGPPTVLANSLSFTAGLLNNFTLNRLWTFQDRQTDWRRQFAQFTLVSLVGLALNNFIVLSLENALGALFGQPDGATCLPRSSPQAWWCSGIILQIGCGRLESDVIASERQ
jgi:putative flippase GtrA